MQIGSGEWCERIRTYNFQANRVTDHRIGLNKQGIDEMMCGNHLKTIIDALRADALHKHLTALSNLQN
jgi:peptide chain release factor 1